ncbi:hypothetical protein L7F22_060713 [Adiantum nelumboides]|nr:hypothetical protein [Adiantum nelumboides]
MNEFLKKETCADICSLERGDVAFNLHFQMYGTSLHVVVRRFFYAEDVPHWKVRSPFFLNIVKAIGQAGPSYVPPSYHLLRTKELVEEVRCINGDLLDVKEKWKKYGYTIVSDGWSDIRKISIINFMACSIYGTVFLKSVDTSAPTRFANLASLNERLDNYDDDDDDDDDDMHDNEQSQDEDEDDADDNEEGESQA